MLSCKVVISQLESYTLLSSNWLYYLLCTSYCIVMFAILNIIEVFVYDFYCGKIYSVLFSWRNKKKEVRFQVFHKLLNWALAKPNRSKRKLNLAIKSRSNKTRWYKTPIKLGLDQFVCLVTCLVAEFFLRCKLSSGGLCTYKDSNRPGWQVTDCNNYVILQNRLTVEIRHSDLYK